MSTLAADTFARIDPRHISTFRANLTGRVLGPGDDAYDAARHIWNAMIDKRPALIAQCTNTADVQQAVSFAREHGLVVSIRGGGHNIAGSALCDGGLTIDLSLMKAIAIDDRARTAKVEGGATWAEFDREAQLYGLATTGGAVSTTGVAGLTLGGGVGWLMGRCGYAVDNLLAAEVVLHDSSVVTASASSHPDLFWALRGGGGNFGIVTSFQFRLHAVGVVLAGLVAHPIERLPEMLQYYRDFVRSAPDELTVHTAIMTFPTGDRVAAFVMVWSGDPDEGERAVGPLRSFGPPIVDMVARMPYTAAQQMLDAAVPYGRHNYWKSGFLRELDDDAAAIIVQHARRITSPYSLCLVEHIHGAATRIPPDTTAFDIRSECFHFVAIASWDPGDDGVPHMNWARGFWTDMQPWAAGRAYGNILTHDDGARVREAYGPSYAQLSQIKARYDPSNFFSVNQNIVPSTSPQRPTTS